MLLINVRVCCKRILFQSRAAQRSCLIITSLITILVYQFPNASLTLSYTCIYESVPLCGLHFILFLFVLPTDRRHAMYSNV